MAEPATSTVSVRVDGPVTTVVLDRPDALNAITPDMLIELGDVLGRLAVDPEVRVVVLTGAGRAFSAGVDLKALGERSLEGGKVGDVLDVPARRVTALLAEMPKATIAAVNGFCFTGALELALACDIVVCADDAKLADTHAKWGLRPTWGMSVRLPAAVGAARARELSLTARTFTGAEAAAWGLAARAIPRDRFEEEVAGLAAEIAANSVTAVAAAKELQREAFGRPIGEGLALEAARSYVIPDTEDRLAGFR